MEAVLNHDFRAARLLLQSEGNPRLALPGGQTPDQMAEGSSSYIFEQLQERSSSSAAPVRSSASSSSGTQRPAPY